MTIKDAIIAWYRGVPAIKCNKTTSKIEKITQMIRFEAMLIDA